MNTSWIFTLIAVLLTALLVGCGSSPKTIVPEGAKPDQLTMHKEIFKVKKGFFKSVEYEADQGTLVVRENRENPHSRLIALPVVRVHSLNKNADKPIFWLAGGPGGSNMKFNKFKGLIDNHDLILVGYRGADGSTILESPEIAKALKGVGDNVLNEESKTGVADATVKFVKRIKAEGTDLLGYNIPEVVEDMEAVRLALGYEKINLLSLSYGTRVAMIYAWMHSGSIHRSAMLAVNPPGHFAWDPKVIDEQIEYYSKLWAKDKELTDRSEDLAQTMRVVSHDMPRHWLFLPINPGKVKLVSFMMLYNRTTAKLVFDAFVSAENGDASGLALMSLAYDLIITNALILGDLFAKGYSDHDPWPDFLTKENVKKSILGSPFSMLLSEMTKPGIWPAKSYPDEYRKVQPTNVETLLLGGSVDFSTPTRFATKEYLPFLTKGRQVIVSEYGHTGDLWNLQPEATVRLLTSFYDTGRADDSLFSYQPMNFNAGILTFPMIAKIMLGVLILLILGLMAGIFLVIRWITRRKQVRD
jgi:pimeloyl-ACP methyl ester carboxylesterase